jgi:hypothetical protein
MSGYAQDFAGAQADYLSIKIETISNPAQNSPRNLSNEGSAGPVGKWARRRTVTVAGAHSFLRAGNPTLVAALAHTVG